jgi:DNA-binding HxlR family transcriptional regulator
MSGAPDGPWCRSRQECATRELLGIVGDRWSVIILIELGDRGPMRSMELKRTVDGISQKVFTACLRILESRDLVSRTVEPTRPVSVTYALSTFGQSFFDALSGLRLWADANVDKLDATRTATG